jgi:mannose-6-phosphate isomerase-like protein (cupin superfamily)
MHSCVICAQHCKTSRIEGTAMTTDTTIRLTRTVADRPLVVAPDEGSALWFGPNRTRILATAEQTHGAFGLMHSWVPDGASPPRHVHHREEEAFYVLEGTLRIVCGDETLLAPAGTFALLPRGVPHTFRAEGGDVRVLTLLTPGGGEGYFAEAGSPAQGSGLPPAGPPDIARLTAAGPGFGIEIVGPPLRD